jgi:predicted alpha/beta-hydrolase family hydrolase
MLFMQGSRDAFGTADEIRALIKRLNLPATLYTIEGGDHSLKVPRSGGVPQTVIYENSLDQISNWLPETARVNCENFTRTSRLTRRKRS